MRGGGMDGEGVRGCREEIGEVWGENAERMSHSWCWGWGDGCRHRRELTEAAAESALELFPLEMVSGLCSRAEGRGRTRAKMSTGSVVRKSSSERSSSSGVPIRGVCTCVL